MGHLESAAKLGLPAIHFSAEEPSRKRLYTYLVPRIIKHPDYTAHHDGDGQFWMVHKDHEAAFQKGVAEHGDGKWAPLPPKEFKGKLGREDDGEDDWELIGHTPL